MNFGPTQRNAGKPVFVEIDNRPCWCYVVCCSMALCCAVFVRVAVVVVAVRVGNYHNGPNDVISIELISCVRKGS